MSRRDDSVRVRHMLDYARAAVRIATGRARTDLDRDEVFRMALTHAVEIVGEAAGHVAESIRLKNPQVAWEQITLTRHRLIHGYDQVDLDRLWTIVENELPGLIAQLENIVEGFGGRKP